MTRKSITRKASDNRYYHPDFHIALNQALDYILKNMGRGAVREYLARFARSHYASLKGELFSIGLPAIRQHYEKIFEIEKANYDIQASSSGELHIRLSGSPAVKHIRDGGYRVSDAYRETIPTVNQEICCHTDFGCELVEYNEENGAYHLRFYKRGE